MSSEVIQKSLHFGARVGVARFVGGSDACGEDLAGFFDTVPARQELAVHLVTGDVGGAAFEERAKVLVGGHAVAGVHAFEGQAVTGEGIVWFLGDEFFKHLAAGFFGGGGLVRHG